MARNAGALQNLVLTFFRHRPLYAGDPLSFFAPKKWIARTSRAMTISGMSVFCKAPAFAGHDNLHFRWQCCAAKC
ncbi:MAG TPA: hypothetical protein VHY79_09415 [Rhizomicrobium sp.]|jgi:hypothetical protein|nr:hypothetical protein [Rhizomicrobium sp.]